jgi:hypothetical protein
MNSALHREFFSTANMQRGMAFLYGSSTLVGGASVFPIVLVDLRTCDKAARPILEQPGK